MDFPWEPAYGFTKTDPVALAATLEMVRRGVCAYGPLATTCDCKYGMGKQITPAGEISGIKRFNSEMTGCPELRSVIRILLHGKVEFDLDAEITRLWQERLTEGNTE